MIIVNYYNIYHACIPFVICQCPSPLALRWPNVLMWPRRCLENHTKDKKKKALVCGHCYSRLSVIVMNTSLRLLTGRTDTERGQHRPGLVSSAAVILDQTQPAKPRHWWGQPAIGSKVAFSRDRSFRRFETDTMSWSVSPSRVIKPAHTNATRTWFICYFGLLTSPKYLRQFLTYLVGFHWVFIELGKWIK